jgi:hypothetical protein
VNGDVYFHVKFNENLFPGTVHNKQKPQVLTQFIFPKQSSLNFQLGKLEKCSKPFFSLSFSLGWFSLDIFIQSITTRQQASHIKLAGACG